MWDQYCNKTACRHSATSLQCKVTKALVSGVSVGLFWEVSYYMVYCNKTWNLSRSQINVINLSLEK